MKNKFIRLTCLLTVLFALATTARAQGTAFTYQGRLAENGAVAGGIYDLRFTIYDALSAGSAVGSVVTNAATSVSNGVFTVALDFGAGVFDGNARWLEISVRTNSAQSFVALSPRQRIAATPYAMRASLATTVSGVQVNTNLASTAFGFNTTADGSYSTAMGNSTTADGFAATALGQSTFASGARSLAAGRETVASGESSTALGFQTTASGIGATSLGQGTTAGGFNSLAAGTAARANHDGTFVWADYNYVDFASTATNQFLIRAAAGVGINTNNPHGAALAVNGNVNVEGIISANAFSGNGAGITNVDVRKLQQEIRIVAAWGWNGNGETTIPEALNNVVAMAGGQFHSLALKSDGTVVAWGDNSSGQTTIPVGLSNVVAIAAGGYHGLALKRDGTVAAWGDNSEGQTTIPVGLSGVVAIAGGTFHSLALKSDGTLAAWGGNNTGQTTIPAGLSNVVAVAGGALHSLALKSDGTVAAWGWNSSGQTTIPVGLSDVVAIVGGGNHSLALKSDGTVAAWGRNIEGQTTIPVGLSGVVAIAAGHAHSLALKSDGTVVAWGAGTINTGSFPQNGQSIIPVGLRNVVAIAGGRAHSLALRKEMISAQIPLLTDNNTFQGSITAAGFTASGNVGLGTTSPQTALHVYSANTPTTIRVQSSAQPGAGRIEFLSDPQGSGSEWRPGYIQSTDNGGFTGGLSFVVNGTGFGNRFAEVETMRVVNGRVGIGTPTPVSALQVIGTVTATAFNPPSDRNLKENFTPVSPRDVLAKVVALPISSWNFKGDAAATPHVGPMAQDFHAAFGLGTDDKHIATVDADGVALAAIQGLNQKLEEELKRSRTKDAEIQFLKEELAAIKQTVEKITRGRND